MSNNINKEFNNESTEIKDIVNKVDVYIELSEGGQTPAYGSIYAAGSDLFATQDMVIVPGERKIMPLNFKMALPSNVEAQIRPRSGLSFKTSLKVANSPGTVDADYRDVVGVIIENNYNVSNLPYEIILNPNMLIELQEKYKKITLKSYLISRSIALSTLHETDDILKKIKFEDLEELKEKYIYVDGNNNPYGSIYIKKGERIAQMIFAEYKQANFIPHKNVTLLGKNRGGGYGHTGA